MDHCKRNADRLLNKVRVDELKHRTPAPEKPTDPQAVKFSESDKAALDELTRNCEKRDRERAMEKNREIQAKNMALRKRLEEIRLRDQQLVAQAQQMRKAGKTAQAVKYLEQLYAGGSAGAPFMLGSMYMAGDGVKQDKKQAVAWLTGN